MFVIIIVLLIIVIYLSYYLRTCPEYELIQVRLNNLKIDHLYEKRPIVIAESIVDIEDLVKTVFAYSYLFKNVSTNITDDQVRKNKNKFLLLYSDNDIAVKIINPKYKKELRKNLKESNVQYVTIKLRAGQVLVLPALWYYCADTPERTLKKIGLNDLISCWFYKLI